MPNIRAKSDENFNAANLLVSSNMHNASIHCAYYSCFQLVKYVFKNKERVDYSNQKSNYTAYVKESQSQQRKAMGSHEYLIQQFIKKSAEKNMSSTIIIRRHILELKGLRAQADYDDSIVKEGESTRCSKMAEEIRRLITEIYEL